jgi:hypothetical protein
MYQLSRLMPNKAMVGNIVLCPLDRMLAQMLVRLPQPLSGAAVTMLALINGVITMTCPPDQAQECIVATKALTVAMAELPTSQTWLEPIQMVLPHRMKPFLLVS